MSATHKGVWFVILLIIILLIYRLWKLYFYSPDIQGIQNKKSSNHLNYAQSDTNFQCHLTYINTADSSTLLHNLNLKPYLVSNLLKYRNKIKFFLSKDELQKVYGWDKIFPKIQHCISYDLPQYPKINLNTADTLQLNYFMPNYLASRLFKYREKKGYFKDWQDVQKVYGLDSHYLAIIQHFTYLEPVSITEKKYAIKGKNIEKLNLNTADSVQLEKLPKIGPKIAARIIKYRNLLPFFVDFKQLSEVYGVNDTILNILKQYSFIQQPNDYKHLNINELDYEKLSMHPYIGKQNARILIVYRNTHGKFSSWEDLKKVKELQLKNQELLKHYFICQ